jgi:hypothetical protein
MLKSLWGLIEYATNSTIQEGKSNLAVCRISGKQLVRWADRNSAVGVYCLLDQAISFFNLKFSLKFPPPGHPSGAPHLPRLYLGLHLSRLSPGRRLTDTTIFHD